MSLSLTRQKFYSIRVQFCSYDMLTVPFYRNPNSACRFLEILIVLLGVIYWSNALGLRGKQTISGELMVLMLMTFNSFITC
jgi:hypothetical protein